MKQVWHLVFYPVLMYLLVLQTGCSPDLAGATTETTNGVTGKLHTLDNVPAANVVVGLFPANFDPLSDADTSSPVHDTTDENGTFFFEDIVPGNYTILAIDSVFATGYYTDGVTVGDDSMTSLSPGILEKTGTVSADFSDLSMLHDGAYIYLPGTDRSARVGNDGTVQLRNVPVGLFSELILTASNGTKRNILTDALSITSNDTVEFVNPLWNYHRDIILNTSADGAGISVDLHDFPVLIRLTDDLFDFSQTDINGKDILFTTPEGTPLNFEIERWDAVEGLAEIWVKIDTVYGNNSTQYLTMYWGNPEATSVSNSASVFDTADGFQGVWHLEDKENTAVYDATGNRYDGTAYNTLISDGAIGNARHFDGSSSRIIMDSTADSRLNMPQNGSYAMSLWVYADTIDTNNWQAIAGKGHEQYYIQLKTLENNHATWEFVEFQDNQGWEYTEDSIPPAPGAGEWLHIVGIRDGSEQQLYINGEMAVDGALLEEGDYPRVSTDDFTIGCYARPVTIPFRQQMAYFNGKVDEVRVMSFAPGPDWIKLCYMNQRKDDKLVMFK